MFALLISNKEQQYNPTLMSSVPSLASHARLETLLQWLAVSRARTRHTRARGDCSLGRMERVTRNIVLKFSFHHSIMLQIYSISYQHNLTTQSSRGGWQFLLVIARKWFIKLKPFTLMLKSFTLQDTKLWCKPEV